jgi:hypothetical protein
MHKVGKARRQNTGDRSQKTESKPKKEYSRLRPFDQTQGYSGPRKTVDRRKTGKTGMI